MEPISMLCGHVYSRCAWVGHLTERVKSDAKGCVKTTCPQLWCNMLVPHSIFLKIMPDVEEDGVNYRKKYIHWHSMQFVDESKNMKYCTNAKENCELIIEKGELSMINGVQCTCGKNFCFKCEQELHDPASCDLVEKWYALEKGGDEDTLNWIKANAKPCPKCKTQIQKVSGCSAMTCTHCKTKFCWFCSAVFARDAHDCECFKLGGFGDHAVK